MRHAIIRVPLLIISVVLVVAVVAGVAATPESDPRFAAPVAKGEDVPPGRWNRLAVPEDERAADEEARTLSLPYLSGRFRATGRDTGVVAIDRERVWAGWNLVVSGHRAQAVLMDMDGEVLHHWTQPFERVFPDREPEFGSQYFRRARLLPDGDLLAIYQGGGMVRLDARSRLVWRFDAGFYNDLRLGPDGNIYSLTKRARRMPEIHPHETVLEDSLVVLSPSGELLREVSLLRAMRESRFSRLLDGLNPMGGSVRGFHPDLLHANTVVPFDGSLAERSPLLRRGNVLFSLRNADVIGILDLRAGEVVWAGRGPWRMQHEPVPLASGRLLLFDNQGGEHARVLELTLPEAEVVEAYGGPQGEPLVSPQAGVIQPLANGNRLIVASESGRAIEITPDEEVVWEFRTPHRAGEHNELVATLFDVIRMPAPAEPPAWLRSPPS